MSRLGRPKSLVDREFFRFLFGVSYKVTSLSNEHLFIHKLFIYLFYFVVVFHHLLFYLYDYIFTICLCDYVPLKCNNCLLV